jgi:hypothetical protein
MDLNQLRREMGDYNSDEDIRNSGGSYGMFLADLMHLYGLTESNFKDLERMEGRGYHKINEEPISQKEFRDLANEQRIPQASRVGAIDSKRELLRLAGILKIPSINGEVIGLYEGNPREIHLAYINFYN